MGKLNQFDISLSENKLVYLAGERVSGQVYVDLAAPMEMKHLKLKFMGKAHVHWSEGSGKNRRSYNATEVLFEQHVILYGEGAPGTDNRNVLPQGQHRYMFDFQLPNELPTSFEDNIGFIRYYLKSTIDKPWKFDHTTKRAFTVLDSLDLNAVPNMLNRSGCSESKQLCCLCCASGPIEVDCQIDRTGYVPGEYVVFNATATNSSNSNIERTSVELVQTVSYRTASKTKTVPKIINQTFGPGISPNGTISWTNERIHIPPLPPSESLHCSIIDIAYSIQFQVHLRTFAINLRAQSPIVIGTVPLRSLELYSNLPPQLPAQSEPNPDPSPIASGAVDVKMPFQNVQPPPPSYAMVASGGVDIRDGDDNNYTMGEMTYTPQYTYYDWNESAFTYNK